MTYERLAAVPPAMARRRSLPLDLVAIRRAIGARVRKARKLRRLTQIVLGRAVGYTAANAISKIEQGQVAMLDVGRLAAIARELDVDFTWLTEPAAAALKLR